MNPDHFINRRNDFRAASAAAEFVPGQMTLGELEDEFPPLPWPYCAITDKGDL